MGSKGINDCLCGRSNPKLFDLAARTKKLAHQLCISNVREASYMLSMMGITKAPE